WLLARRGRDAPRADALALPAPRRGPGGRACRRALDRLLGAHGLAERDPVRRHHAAGETVPRRRRAGMDPRPRPPHRHRPRWRVWDGRRWAEDETGDAERHAKDVVAQMFAAAARADDETRRKQLGAWAVKSASAPRLAALLEVARSEREFAITGREFDRDPW